MGPDPMTITEEISDLLGIGHHLFQESIE